MTTSGVLVLLIIIFSVFILFAFKSQLLKRKMIIVFKCFCIISALYFLGARYILDVIDFIKDKNITPQWHEVLLSKIFLLDLCPLMAIMLPLAVVFDFKNNFHFAKIISPVALIGAVVTLFGQSIFDSVPQNLFAKYLFLGLEPNRLYFMMHFLTLIISLWVLIICKKYKYRDYCYTIIFYSIWLLYITVISYAYDIKWNVTGLVANDWLSPFGEYHKVYKLFPLPFPCITVFWYTIAFIVNFLIIQIKNLSLWYKNRKISKKESQIVSQNINNTL